MKRMRFLSLLLAVLMLLGCAVACDSTDGETPEVPENQEQDAPKYELSNIRADIAQYTVVRPDGKDAIGNNPFHTIVIKRNITKKALNISYFLFHVYTPSLRMVVPG